MSDFSLMRFFHSKILGDAKNAGAERSENGENPEKWRFSVIDENIYDTIYDTSK